MYVLALGTEGNVLFSMFLSSERTGDCGNVLLRDRGGYYPVAPLLKRTRPRAERADGQPLAPSFDSGFFAPDSPKCPLVGPCNKDTSKRKVGRDRHGLESKWVLAHTLAE